MTATGDAGLGHCRCGQVRFAVAGRPLLTMACHCTGCQRMSASAFSVSALFGEAAFELLSGAVVLGGLKGPTQHFFCASCLGWLFTRPEGETGLVNVRATLLERPMQAPPFIETWTREKLPWAVLPVAHSFEALPPPQRFPELVAAFAAEAW